MTVRTRFAPSPTGDLHIGGARTALFAWLYARHHQGQFILRIEDTDRERSTQASTDAILDAMNWLGLDYDEGPYYQTKRFERYQEVISEMLKAGTAYRCYCPKSRLDTLREQQMQAKQKPRYDGHCRELEKTPTDQPYVIRFRNPKHGEVSFHDEVRGQVRFQNEELDDLIIARTDGTPTYNFTVVVDDLDMRISHVIRGDDHVNNTPRQINMMQALGATPPTFAHVPMILGPDGKRLSKRDGAASVMQYRDDGILPQALLNYIVRLGWSFGDQEIFSRGEMIEHFNTHSINKAPAALNPDKLLWLNQHYLKTLSPNDIINQLSWHLKKANLTPSETPDLKEVLSIQTERCKTLSELVERSRFFYQEINHYEEKAAKKNLTPQSLTSLEHIREQLNCVSDWNKETIHAVIENTAESLTLKLGKVAQPIRVAISGTSVSPPIDISLALLGKEKTLARIDRAILHIKDATKKVET